MKVEITKQTMAAKQVARPGDIVDLPEKEARLLININRAKPLDQQLAEFDSEGEEVDLSASGAEAPAAGAAVTEGSKKPKAAAPAKAKGKGKK